MNAEPPKTGFKAVDGVWLGVVGLGLWAAWGFAQAFRSAGTKNPRAGVGDR
jgi:hypothetical protein